jgi:hypothetical protein
MPVKRRVSKERQLQISPEMVATWNELRLIVAAGDHLFWEDEGGQKRRYYDLDTKLSNELLHRLPHECPMTATLVYGPCPVDDAEWKRWGIEQEWQKQSYEDAFELKRLLDEAANVKHQRSTARERLLT